MTDPHLPLDPSAAKDPLNLLASRDRDYLILRHRDRPRAERVFRELEIAHTPFSFKPMGGEHGARPSSIRVDNARAASQILHAEGIPHDIFKGNPGTDAGASAMKSFMQSFLQATRLNAAALKSAVMTKVSPAISAAMKGGFKGASPAVLGNPLTNALDENIRHLKEIGQRHHHEGVPLMGKKTFP